MHSILFAQQGRFFAPFFLLLSLLFAAASPLLAQPVLIGLDAEFGHKTSTSAQAVQQGMEIAIDEINQAGGVLGGRKLALVLTDNRSMPAVGVDNLKLLASKPDLVGVFGAKFSPVVMEWIPVAQALGIPIFAPWSSADPITDHNHHPSFSFRLSLKDAWAAPALLRFASKEHGAKRVGVLLPNTGWGRSNQAAIVKEAAKANIKIVGEHWYNWGDKSLIELYLNLLHSGAQSIILVANEMEGSVLVKEMAALPKDKRLPIVSHWGITGGEFSKMTGEALNQVDLTVIQTFSFVGAKNPAAKRVLAALKSRYGIENEKSIQSAVGIAHAYDLTHILARAINKAGSTDRSKIRDALEQLGPYNGLVRRYSRPFTPTRHDALSQEQVFMARFTSDGTLIPIPWTK